MVERIELVAINHFPLDIGMQRLDVSVVLRRGHVRELLINAFLSEVLANCGGNELRSIVVSDGHAFTGITVDNPVAPTGSG